MPSMLLRIVGVSRAGWGWEIFGTWAVSRYEALVTSSKWTAVGGCTGRPGVARCACAILACRISAVAEGFYLSIWEALNLGDAVKHRVRTPASA